MLIPGSSQNFGSAKNSIIDESNSYAMQTGKSNVAFISQSVNIQEPQTPVKQPYGIER
jgi:hypothetical protein